MEMYDNSNIADFFLINWATLFPPGIVNVLGRSCTLNKYLWTNFVHENMWNAP